MCIRDRTTTDENGMYEFAGLPADVYQVEFVEPEGYDFTDQNVGDDDSVDSDANEQTGISLPEVISPNETDNTIDAGVVEYDLGDLPDTYNTLESSDGARHVLDTGTFLGSTVDGEEDGLPSDDALGDDTDDILADDEDGVTFLDPLVPGTEARIEVVAGSDGFLNAWIDFNSNGTLDEVTITAINDDDASGTLNDVALAEGTHVITVQVPTDATGTMAARFRFTSDDPVGALGPDGSWDNGEVEDYVLGAIGDQVWLDNGTGDGSVGDDGVGNDGIQNGDEPGVRDVVVNLLDENGQPVTDANDEPITTTTDSDGNYQFPGLPAGQYQVEFELPTGYQFTETDQGDPDTGDYVDSDANEETGVTETYSIAPGENNDTVDAGVQEQDFGDLRNAYKTRTNVDGAVHGIDGVTFLGTTVDPETDGIPSANALGDDNRRTPDDEDGVVFDTPLMPGTEAQITVTASTDGFLNAWIDFNSNRTFDEGEQIAIDQPLTPGENTLEISVPADATGPMATRFRFTADDPAGELGSNGAWDNGEVEDYILGSIGDTVWVDNGAGDGTSGDGIQNGDEPGLEGVVVNLLDGDGDAVLDGDDQPITTTTDENGLYEFPGLPAGDYQVQFVEPDGYDFTGQDQDTDDPIDSDTLDSDADVDDGTTATTSIEPGDVVDTVDAGVLEYDRGDLPDEYSTLESSDGARHVIDTGTFLGSGVDSEEDGAPSIDALGDDTDDGVADDEDGVTFLDPLMPGTEANIQVVASTDGFLNAWICLLYTSPSPRDATLSRMPSSA